jgi:hypothetical protein
VHVPRVRASQPTLDCVDLNLWFRNAALGLFADTSFLGYSSLLIAPDA